MSQTNQRCMYSTRQSPMFLSLRVVTRICESSLAYLSVISRTSTRHHTRTNESCQTQQRFIYHTSKLKTLIDTCDISFRVCDMTRCCVCHDSLLCVTWLVVACDMTRCCVWHDSSLCVPWLVVVCDMTRYCVWHDSSLCVPWLVVVCDMTRYCVWHDSLLCVTYDALTSATRLIDTCDISLRVCDMTRCCVQDVCDMTHWCVCHDSLLCVRYDALICATRLIDTCDISFRALTWLIVAWHDSLLRDMTHCCVTWLIVAWHDSLLRVRHVLWGGFD